MKKEPNYLFKGTCLLGGCFIIGFSIGIGMGAGFTMVICYVNSNGLGVYNFLYGVYKQYCNLLPL